MFLNVGFDYVNDWSQPENHNIFYQCETRLGNVEHSDTSDWTIFSQKPLWDNMVILLMVLLLTDCL